ncbi:MAG: cadmium resistance transporter [Candidatus Bathyarchaeia archaeon]
MEPVLLAIALGIVAFTATNIGDLFVLVMFFSNPSFSTKQVVTGQYIGVSSLIAISAVSYFAAFIVPSAWIRLMGVFPIIIGIKNLVKRKTRKTPIAYKIKPTGESQPKIVRHPGHNILSVAIVSFADGGDNIAVYVPLFASSSLYQLAILLTVFLIMIGVWCMAAYCLLGNKIAGERIRKYGHILFPFVLIGLGLVILLR